MTTSDVPTCGSLIWRRNHNKIAKTSILPGNHGEWEEQWIEEKEPQATFGSVGMTVEADQPIVALQKSRKHQNRQRHQGPLL